MSDTILNKLVIKNKQVKTQFSKREMQMENKEVISELDKRITDILHKIEFYNPTSAKEALKIYSKLQHFLKKKRALKEPHKVYVPRTESGNYIRNGKVTDEKRRNDEK